MRTYVATPKTIDSRWHVIDADGQVLGRVATLAARLLQGKHKPTYTPFIDTGDHVVIVEEAVHGMLPKTTLGAAMYRKLKVYAGPDHPHMAQKPSAREVA